MTTTSPPASGSPASPAAERHSQPRTGVWVVLAAAAILIIVALLWFSGAFASRPRVALVTAGQGPYWDLIVKGAQEAAHRHGVNLDVKTPPPGDEAAQSRILAALSEAEYDGVAVSPTDSIRQARTLAEVAVRSNLVTFDADCPVSRRLCFVGTDNYDAGRLAGQHVREALPQGGSVILSISSLDKENGQRRRQGVIDELLERTFEPNRPADPADEPLEGQRYTILATLVDDYDMDRATALAAEAVKSNPKLGCFVGLFAANTPAILMALEQTGTLGKIKVVGFDANEETMTGIERGHVYATIVQDAYNIGYQAVRILADASQGEANALPLFPTFYLRCDPVTRENLAQMRIAMATRHKPAPRPTTQSAPEE